MRSRIRATVSVELAFDDDERFDVGGLRVHALRVTLPESAGVVVDGIPAETLKRWHWSEPRSVTVHVGWTSIPDWVRAEVERAYKEASIPIDMTDDFLVPKKRQRPL